MAPKQFKLNVGGTRYDVSDALLDRFQDSMLRKITSDRWNESDDDDSSDTDHTKEIFIERDGGRFQIILDYMRDGNVVLPLSIPRLQLISEMEYYGIDFDESKIILDVVDSKDTFRKFSEFFNEQRRYKSIYEPKRKELDARFRGLAAESVSCKVASRFFERLLLDRPSSTFKAKEIRIGLSQEPKFDFSIEELQPHLKEYGLNGYDLFCGDVGLKIKVENRKMDTTTIQIHEEERQNTVCEETPTKGKMTPKRFKFNVGGTRYEVSDSLLNQFQDSMLRKITSDLSLPGQNKEIFIERDGGIFKFVLDYMRDHKVFLPLSVPRPQLVSDMEYYGIDFDESQITLNVADPNDTFHKLSEYYYEKERFKHYFESKLNDIEARYHDLAVESVSCAIASDYFEQQFSDMSSFTFEAKKIHKFLGLKEQFNFYIKELQSHLNLYGLHGFDIEQRKKIARSPSSYYGGEEETYIRVEEPDYIELQVKML